MKHEKNQRALIEGAMLHGRFIVEKIIGTGGFGITYLGEDTLLNSKVAIKEDAFLEEAKVLSRCQELDGIVSIRDFFSENGRDYIVMEYISGCSLKEKVQKEGKIEAIEALRMLKPVIRSLAALHQMGYIHRDISGDNLLFTSQGQLKLIDFGSARRKNPEGEDTRTVIFKRGFAAEEQYRAKGKQGAYTDVYGISAVLYFMMTGEIPVEAVERVIHDTLIPFSEREDIALDSGIKRDLDKGIAVFREKRFQNMEAFYEAVYGEKLYIVGEEKKQEVHAEKNSREKKIEKANFLATRTEFLEKKKAYYLYQRAEKDKRRKRYILFSVLFLGLFFVMLSVGVHLWKPEQKKDANGYASVGSNKTVSEEKATNAPESGALEGTEAAGEALQTDEPSSTVEPLPTTKTETKIEVPKVTGLEKKKAIRVLKKAGFSYQIKYAYSSHVEKGSVVSQKIKAGKRVKKGTKLTLVISRGRGVIKQVTMAPQTSSSKSSSSQKNSVSKKKKSKTKKQSADSDITNLFD